MQLCHETQSAQARDKLWKKKLYGTVTYFANFNLGSNCLA